MFGLESCAKVDDVIVVNMKIRVAACLAMIPNGDTVQVGDFDDVCWLIERAGPNGFSFGKDVIKNNKYYNE